MMQNRNYFRKAVLTCSAFALVGAFALPAVAASSLTTPFDVPAVRAKTGKKDNKPLNCKTPPEPMRDIKVESFYREGDKSYSIVDEKKHSAYKKASKPASVFEIGLGGYGNRYVRSAPPRADVAACAAQWMASWARAGALLGEVNKNGEYTRKWLLGSIASDWMQIRDEPSLDATERRDITKWIRDVAEQVKSDFSRDTDLKSRQNNHIYWAAWALTAAGMALNDREFFNWGVEHARNGIKHIEADGTLPLEVARGRRAYLYHMFAAMPLFMVANAAGKNGIDLFKENGSALKRLGDLCLSNLGDGHDFVKMTGEEQDLARVGTASDTGWIEIYRQHYNNLAADAALQKFRPAKQSRFGGNITLLYAQLNVPSPKKEDKAEKPGK